MAAIPNRRLHELETAIFHLKSRINNLYQLHLTHEEFLSLMAPPEHHRILMEAAKVAHVYSAGSNAVASLKSDAFSLINGNTLELRFFVNPVGGITPLMPRNTHIMDDAPIELRNRLEEWVLARVEQNLAISRVERLLAWLSCNCENDAQVRFLWPTIIALCAQSESLGLQDYGDRLRTLKRPRSLPDMPPEVRAAFKATAGVVAGASLLPKEAPPEVRPPVSVELYSVNSIVHEGALGWLNGG